MFKVGSIVLVNDENHRNYITMITKSYEDSEVRKKWKTDSRSMRFKWCIQNRVTMEYPVELDEITLICE